jgi:Flp pilus assembly pilin Flp
VNYPAEEGATAVEYSLMAGLITAVIAAVVAAFGLGVNGLFQSLVTLMWP